jgi:hypothetical protein
MRQLNLELRPGEVLNYNFGMILRRTSCIRCVPLTLRVCWLACVGAIGLAVAVAAQQAPPASGARILLLPHRVVSGERATLAVLDVNGRLTPGVTVTFSNGDRLTTDATGRALFVAPLNPGVIFGSLAGRAGRVPIVVLSPMEATTSSMEIDSAPRIASVTDRFELQGKGFCGDADANQVTVAGKKALVLASSPTSLTILPPADVEAGDATVEVSCAKRAAAPFGLTLVELALEADSSTLKPGEHRTLLVRVRGASSKIALEAVNLSPEIAELVGGSSVRVSTTGGTENTARFELVGRGKGSFLISIRLTATYARPHS